MRSIAFLRRRTIHLALAIAASIVALALRPSPAPAGSPCFGDCDGDSVVTVAELVLSVEILLDASSVSQCPASDRDSSGSITIDEIAAALANSLNGCPG
jgi:hypothetical protein